MAKQKISEAELCSQFIEYATKKGWKAYPEQNGWDFLLFGSGIQVGVQAKLTLNTKVLEQAIPKVFDGVTGPDFRAILVPENTAPTICSNLGIVVFTPIKQLPRQMTSCDEISLRLRDELRWYPEKRYPQPEYESGSVAGSPCPVTLTDWKIKALKIIARCEVRGYVTSKDFKQLNISPTMWLYSNRKWLKPLGDGKFGIGKVDFHLTHPAAYAKILYETKKIEGSND